MVCFDDHFAFGVLDGLAGETSCNTLLKAFNLFPSVHEGFHPHTRNLAFVFTAVHLTDDQILGNVNQTSCQVTGVSGTQSCIRQTFTSTMGGHEVFQYVQTFTEIGLDGQLDGVTCCIGHQTTHTGKLFDLLIGTTGTGVSHHEDVVVLIKSCQQGFGKLIVSLLPCLNDFFISLFFRDKTTFEVFGDKVNRILCLLDHLRFLRRHSHVGDRYGHGSSG